MLSWVVLPIANNALAPDAADISPTAFGSSGVLKGRSVKMIAQPSGGRTWTTKSANTARACLIRTICGTMPPTKALDERANLIGAAGDTAKRESILKL
jgi:hypothetical protein